MINPLGARRHEMAVTYKKLFHMLIDRNMPSAQLQQEAGYSASISTRLRRDYTYCPACGKEADRAR